jgi:hypothetical protein
VKAIPIFVFIAKLTKFLFAAEIPFTPSPLSFPVSLPVFAELRWGKRWFFLSRGSVGGELCVDSS